MTIAECAASLKYPLRDATLLFLVDGDRLLLAMKKRGFGQGKWNGVGGKVEEGETIEAAAVREAEEEIGVRAEGVKRVATLDFYFPHVDEEERWNQRVHVFLCRSWRGEPQETEEMRPQWFAADAVPFHEMWSDDEYWLPKVLKGLTVEASFAFGKNQEVLEAAVSES